MSNNITQIITLLSNIEEVQNILNKNLFIIQKDQLTKLIKVLSSLLLETKENTSFHNIFNTITEIFKDGKIEIHEIPLLIKILSENISIKNINSNDLSLLIKFIIIILVQLDIIKLNTTDINIINTLIDTSLELLNIQFNIPLVKEKINKCCVWKILKI
jgi:hypothetical protein